MTDEARRALREKALALLREHCGNVVLVTAWMEEDGSLDDDVRVDCHGTLHGCLGLVSIADDRLHEILADRYESGKEDE